MADPNATPSPLSLPNPDYEGPLGGEGAAAYMKAIGAHKTEAEKREEIAKRAEARRPKEEAESERAYAGAERAAAQPRPPVPQMERVESPPKPEDYQKMSMGYLGAMVLLGAFGGKFIRNAANAPLAAFNGALTGWQEGNLEAYKEKSAEWKEKQQQVLDNNRARLDEYRTILEDRNASIQDQMLRVKLTAAKHQDKMMYDRADAENWTGVAQAYDQGVAVHEKAVAATDKIVEQLTTQNETSVERANQWKAHLETPQGQQQFNQMTPAQQMQVKGFINTYADQAPAAAAPALEAPGPAGGSMPTEPPPGTPIDTSTTLQPQMRMPPELRAPFPPPKMHAAERDAWYFEKGIWDKYGRPPTDQERGERYRQQHPARTAGALSLQEYIDETIAETGKPPSAHDLIHFRAEQIGEEQRGRTAGGMAARSSAATEEVAMALPLALTSSRQLPRGRFVKFNQLMQAWEQGTSDKRYNDFMVKNISLLNAYVRAMNPQGNPRIAERLEAHAVGLLSTATDQPSYETQLRAIWQEVVNQRKAIAQTRSGAPGSDEFPEPDAGAGGGGGAGGDGGSVLRYDEKGQRIK